MVDTPHYFGGVWTELKLEVIGAYSKFFTGALKAKDFDLWYIDPSPEPAHAKKCARAPDYFPITDRRKNWPRIRAVLQGPCRYSHHSTISYLAMSGGIDGTRWLRSVTSLQARTFGLCRATRIALYKSYLVNLRWRRVRWGEVRPGPSSFSIPTDYQ